MIFWTVVFITYYMASLVKGNLYYNSLQKCGELSLKAAEVTDKKDKEVIAKDLLKSSGKMLLSIPFIIAMAIYFFVALGIDIYKYPTIIMLFYMLFSSFVLNKNTNKSKYDLNTEEGRIKYKIFIEKIKRYTFKGFITNLIYIGYFGYMFYLLVLR